MKEKVGPNSFPQRFKVEVERPNLTQEIIIGKGMLDRVADLVDLSLYSQFVIITDKNVGRRFGVTLKKGLRSANNRVRVFEIETGEINKTEENANKIVSNLLSVKNPPIDRNTLLLALGGGVVGDITGYVAGKSLRGLDYLQIPTTLLAMVDSSLGGKTGVNHDGITNMIGLFHLPKATIMDIATLKTLSEREFKSGMGELAKHALLHPMLFEYMLNLDPNDLRKKDFLLIDLLRLSAEYKMGVVGQDFEEKTGARKELNLGHTIGRALETATGLTRFSHGEAVSVGMAGAIMISNLEGLLSKEDADMMLNFLKRFGLPTAASNVDPSLLRRAMGHDKKSIGGEPRFVLLEGVGKPKIDCIVDEKVIGQALKQIIT